MVWDNLGVFELSVGQIVADKYRIDGIIGSGGMGVVAAATHVGLDQRVAIKFLREVAPETLARFRREARLLVKMKSPHVARVFDVGTLDDDTPYIVMEHLDGSDLASLLRTRGPLPVQEAVDYVLQAMEAVAEAHALGMVHRDLKPANLFLAKGTGGTTTVKVLDFGVSKVLDPRGDATDVVEPGVLTNEGVVLGSPGYMSPEQMTSARDVDARSDVFSLGAMLYRLVTGQPPYPGNTIVSILARMATERVPSLDSVVAGVPAGFADVVERCLAHDRVARWPSVAHLAEALLPYAGRRGRHAIEQITATLGLAAPKDAFGDTAAVARPPSATVPAASTLMSRPSPSSPSAPSWAAATQLAHAESAHAMAHSGSRPSVPPFSSYAGPAMPSAHAPIAPQPRETASRFVLSLGGGIVLGFFVAVIAWRTSRTPARADDAASERATTSAAASIAPTPVSVDSTPPIPSPASSAVEVATTDAPPIKPKPPTTRPPRPHGAGNHGTAASATASPPPVPTDRR